MTSKTLKKNNQTQRKRLLRLELWFAPFLVVVPLIVSIVFIAEWYFNGYLKGISMYDGEAILGLVIFLGNILFDIPFLKSLKTMKKI